METPSLSEALKRLDRAWSLGELSKEQYLRERSAAVVAFIQYCDDGQQRPKQPKKIIPQQRPPPAPPDETHMERVHRHQLAKSAEGLIDCARVALTEVKSSYHLARHLLAFLGNNK